MVGVAEKVTEVPAQPAVVVETLPSDYPKKAVAIVLGERRFDSGVEPSNPKVARAYVSANYCFDNHYEPAWNSGDKVTLDQIGKP